MNVEEVREFCLSLKAATECTPFDDVTLVFKVGEKMFALIPLDEAGLSINLKCEPEKAVSLREEYPSVRPGYHMNKKHWNTVYISGTIDRKLILGWIVDSYNLVVSSLPAKTRTMLDL